LTSPTFHSAWRDAPLLTALRRRSLAHPGHCGSAGDSVPAVVFAPLVLPHWEARLEDARMLFIKRSSGLRKHAGQVGFPGGRVEPGDQTLLEAGFREAEEEVALARSSVEVLCPLPTAEVPSGYQLYPFFVATDQQEFVSQESEVEAVHLVAMTDLLTCPFRLEHKEWHAKVYRVVYFDLDDLCVWGVTGRIVEHLLETFFEWRPPGAR
jgi:8-oxo-dGTP pyrophosphatase MutT (NUDIX family)